MTIKKLKDYSGYKLVDEKLEMSILRHSLTFAEMVKSLRERDSISQTELAKKVGISKQYLCDIEKGRRHVSPEKALSFAKAFSHPPHLFVKLCLQDQLDEIGLNMIIDLKAA